MRLPKHIFNLRKPLLVASAIGLGSMSFIASSEGSSPAYNFLDITSSSKIYGLGGLNISLVDDDISVTGQNPALLGQEMSNQLSIGYMRYLAESSFASLRYGHSLGTYGAWSGAIDFFGYGEIMETLPDGTSTGNRIKPIDASFSAAYSHDITDRIRGGVALKFLYSSYSDYTALALATDIGVNYYDEERDLSLSAVIANLGGQIKRFDQKYDRLPFDIRLGWSQSFGNFPIRFSITAYNLTKWKLPYWDHGDGSAASKPVEKNSFGSNLFRHLVFGADLVSSDNFFVGVGYNYKTRTDMSTYSRNFFSGFSVCGGFKVRNFNVTAAFAQPHTGATTFMLNLTCGIDQFLR